MGMFDLPHDEVVVHIGRKKKTVAFIDGLPHLSEVQEWASDFNADKITVNPAEGRAYTVYEDGNIQNCIL